MGLLTRRGFMAGSLAAGAAMTLPMHRVLGANDDIRVGIVGLGGRGRHSANWFSGLDGVRIVAVSDPDKNRIARTLQDHEQADGYTDFRELLDRQDVDVAVFSCPVHWHTLAAIWAMEAGKDVYVEKPVSHNVWEGRQLVKAARKHNKIVQGGTQQRSDPVQPKIREMLKSGRLGAVKYVRANRYGVRPSIGRRSDALTPPEHVDYNLWLGPARDEPLYRDDFHYDWHWMWNTGSGEMGNWGVHIIDDVRMTVLGDQPMPRKVIAGGGRFAWDDAGETPNTHFVYYETDTVPVVFDLRNLPTAKGERAADHYMGVRSGYVIHCEEGYYTGGRGGGTAFNLEGEQIERLSGDGGGNHAKNFIDAVRSRNRDEQNAEVEQTHYSSAWCHLGNVAYRAGNAFSPGEAKEMVEGFAPWQEVVEGFYTHLEANEADPNGARLGPVLEIDAENESITGPAATDETLALLRREYREGFEVKEQ